jgi:alpha-L-rhamnosidase
VPFKFSALAEKERKERRRSAEMRSLLLSLSSLTLGLGLNAPAQIAVEYMRRPTIETPQPRFYWEPDAGDSARGIVQSAYQIVVTNSLTGSNVWDSSKVASSSSSHVVYAGAPLQSDTAYNFSITWWDGAGVSSPPGFGEFSMGLLTQAEWEPAAWIGCPLHATNADLNYNQLRTEFDLQLAPGVKITQARAYLAAVGYAALRINGEPAPHYSHGTRVRNDPGWTTYELRSLYSSYDITDLLSPSGPNALGIWQANGWPDIGPVPGNSSKKALRDNVGGNRQTRMLLSIHDSTGAVHQIVTSAPSFSGGGGGTWQCGAGSLLYDNIYNGVTWDQRLYTAGWDMPNFPPGSPSWTSAVLRADPGGEVKTVMTSQAFPAVTVQAELPALTVNSPSPGVYVFDFGQNLAGFVRLTLPAPFDAGVTLTLRHAELLQHPPYGPLDGSIYVGNLRSARATDVYITGGVDEGEEVWEPPIGTYHGFRFVELSGMPFMPSLDTVTAIFIRSDVEVAGFTGFPTTANTLNQLQHAVSWGIGCNLMSVISDCPQRDERKGWMG